MEGLISCLVLSSPPDADWSIHAMRTCEGPASFVNSFFTHYSFPRLTHSSRPYDRDTLGSARNVLHLGALSVPSRIGGKRIMRTCLTLTRWFVIVRAHAWLIHQLTSLLVLLLFVVDFPLSGWVCQWKPFWIPVGESCKKSPLGGMDLYRRRLFRRTTICEFPCARTYVMMHLQHPDQRGRLFLFPGNLLRPRIRRTFGKEMRHHCLLYGTDETSSTQGSPVPFLNA